jgi:hypothetical protein
MKKYLAAGFLAACLTAPACATSGKPATRSPNDPLPRSAIMLCMGLLVAAHAYKRRQSSKQQDIVAYML